jgi:hypothetical protein
MKSVAVNESPALAVKVNRVICAQSVYFVVVAGTKSPDHAFNYHISDLTIMRNHSNKARGKHK